MEISVVNNDTTAATVGDIAASSSQNFGAVLALADSSTLNIIGVWSLATREGRVGQVKDGLLEVNCVSLPAVGDKLYVSDAVEGKATNVKPEFPYYIGSVISKVTLATGVHKATVVFNTQSAEGGITAAGARTSLHVGQQTINPQTGTTYAPVTADANNIVTLSNAAAITVTLPTPTSISVNAGETVTFVKEGAGDITYVAGSGATVNSPESCLRQITQFSMVFATAKSTTLWNLSGALVA